MTMAIWKCNENIKSCMCFTTILTKVRISSNIKKMPCHPIAIGSGESQNLLPLKFSHSSESQNLLPLPKDIAIKALQTQNN
jgi:hypothetical protein